MDSKYIQWAKAELGDVIKVEKEPHGDQSEVTRLHTPRGIFFLKVGEKLSKEKEKLDWLQGKASVPKVVAFKMSDDEEALLLSGIEGTNLTHLTKEWPPEKVVQKLIDALHTFHSIDIVDCPFGQPGPGKVLVHGDACLPNFIFQGDNLSGYIDLGDLMIAAPEVDFSAAIWSLQYNLGVGYGRMFLEKYGVENVSDEMVEKLRLKYEDMQKAWGL